MCIVSRSFGGSPFAQSRRDDVYKKTADPFEGFGSEPHDHFAEGMLCYNAAAVTSKMTVKPLAERFVTLYYIS